MRWTAEKDAQLLELARDGVDDATAGLCFGVSGSAVYQRARITHGIIMGRAPGAARFRHASIRVPPDICALSGSAGLRARWAALIGPMKEALRADIAGSA